ncbi:MAG: hypothetical protein EA351_02740 [Gemmatimonadales bacterium]|nr:MAG: hypothetical protein EA351_02740 [Gemmatimonadales bacterium]
MPFHPRPSREELATWPLQVIVRDFPETLAILRDHGLMPEELGEQTMRDIPGGGALLDGLEEQTAWRPQPVRA